MKRVLSPTVKNRPLISKILSQPIRRKAKCEKHNSEVVWKEPNDELAGC